MHQGLVITFITDDKPGVVEKLSQLIAEHEGNWQESRLSQLAGKFAGIIRTSLPAGQVAGLQEALTSLKTQGFTVVIENLEGAATEASTPLYKLSVVGLDRPGIVRQVSSALAQRGINVVEMSTDLSSVAMSGEPLFEAEVLFSLPDAASLDELEDKLDAIAAQLTVDISIETTV